MVEGGGVRLVGSVMRARYYGRRHQKHCQVCELGGVDRVVQFEFFFARALYIAGCFL